MHLYKTQTIQITGRQIQIMREEYWNTLIQKQLANICTAEEQQELDTWLAENDQNRLHYKQLVNIDRELKQLDFSVKSNVDQDWQALTSQLQLDTDQQNSMPVVPLNRRRWLNIAASLLFLIAAGWMTFQYLGPETTTPGALAQEYQTKAGERQTIKLTDGTEVELNGQSKLIVSTDFNGKNRTVKLTGEGWFQVAKDPQRPFVIESEGVFVKVLGTAFNLRAYPGEEQVEIAVDEGRVQFYDQPDKGIILVANNAGTFTRSSRQIEKIPYDSVLAQAWRAKALQFDNIPFETALKALGKRFDKKFINQTGAFDEPLSAQFDVSTELPQILSQFEMLYGLKFEINDQEIIVRK